MAAFSVESFETFSILGFLNEKESNSEENKIENISCTVFSRSTIVKPITKGFGYRLNTSILFFNCDTRM